MEDNKRTPVIASNAEKNIQIGGEGAYERLNRRNRLFVDTYILNYFNAVKAYMMVYPKSDYKSSLADASRLLSKANVKKAVDERFKVLRPFDAMTKQDFLREVVEEKGKSLKESTKARLLELQAKVQGFIHEDTRQNIAVFSNAPDLVERRMRNIDVTNDTSKS